MGLLELVILFAVGLLVPILLFRWFMQKYVGHDAGMLDHMDNVSRSMGDQHWQNMNERRAGEAEKNKAHHAFDGARIQASPTPMHITETSRLALDEQADTSEPVPLSDLLPDKKQSKRQ